MIEFHFPKFEGEIGIEPFKRREVSRPEAPMINYVIEGGFNGKIPAPIIRRTVRTGEIVRRPSKAPLLFVRPGATVME